MRAIVSPREFALYMERLSGGFIPAVKRGILSGAMRGLTVLDRRTREARSANPRGIGTGGAVDKGGGGGFIGRWKVEATATGAVIRNNAVYAPVIEWGRRVGSLMPPVKVIARWAQRRIGLSPEEAKRAAFSIARAIQKRGLLPRLILTDAIPELMSVTRQEVDRELAQEMSK